MVVLCGTRQSTKEKPRSNSTRAKLHVPPSPPRVSRVRRGKQTAREWQDLAAEDNARDEENSSSDALAYPDTELEISYDLAFEAKGIDSHFGF